VTHPKITILIRVYNRIDDLVANIKIIRLLWKKFNKADIIVSFNGKEDGYFLPEVVSENANHVIELATNLGHLKGNSQMILEAYSFIPEDTDFLVLLEADTWLLDDSLIDRYVEYMKNENYVWCSAEWSKRTWSLGIDFAIVRYSVIKKYCFDLFNFGLRPEQWVCDFLSKNDLKFFYISELNPVHIPKILSILAFVNKRRNHVFLKAKMITHHIEELKNGIKEKYAIANCLIGSNFFVTDVKINCFFLKLKYLIINIISVVLPNSSWFRNKKHIFMERMC